MVHMGHHRLDHKQQRKVNITLIHLLTLHKYRMDREKSDDVIFQKPGNSASVGVKVKRGPGVVIFLPGRPDFPSLACWNFTSNGEIACAQ